MLCGDHRALDDENVEPRLQRCLVVLGDPLGRERGGADHALLLDLADPLRDQLLLDRLAVDPLHLGRRLIGLVAGDRLEVVLGVLVAGEDPLEVEDGKAAQLAHDARGGGRDDAVHGRGEEGELEAIRAERPGDVDVVRIARAP